ncbi:MAG: ATP-binding cassette domain-containing protein, partial [Lentisphaeria bacterium]|nr:ATP-binding cassette domain-containing protein [Lentisphaeria bacterium]
MTSSPETAAAPADAVRFEHVGLTLGENRILDDVCAHVPRGKFTAIVGPNGAGKTTLTLAILGQIKHTGKVLFPGL